VTLSDTERDLITHAVGRRRGSRGRLVRTLRACYRNRFEASVGSEDDLAWALAGRGLAELRRLPAGSIPYNCWAVTDAGFAALLTPPAAADTVAA
jgi:hypothetical protein